MLELVFRDVLNWPSVGGFVIGLLAALGIQRAVLGRLVKAVSTTDPQDGRYCHIWRALRERSPRNFGGETIGRFEVTLIFMALLVAPDGAPIAIGAYLAFKVASKWEVWGQIVRVPDHLPGVDDIEYFAFRARWGQEVFNRFVTGTLTNVIVAVAGAGVARLASQRLLRFAVIGD